MKKQLLIISFLTLSMFGFSQTMLLEEYFNDPVNLPATWDTIDQDGDTFNWYVDTYDAEIYLVSESYRDETPLTPENYLITPQINLAGLVGSVRLRYTIQVADEEYFAEHYKVAVSTTGTAVEDFTNIVFEETCTADDYYEVPPYWHERIVDLTPFIGQNIYLTFCHYDCVDQYKFLLDSVQVYNLDNVNITNHDLFKLNVYPNPATEEVYVNGEFDNAGISILTMDGRKVYSAANISRQAYINLAEFERGMYLIQIESSKGTVTRKLAIAR